MRENSTSEDMTGKRITVRGKDLKDGARHTHWDGQKGEGGTNRKIASVGKEWENLELLHSVSGHIRRCSYAESGKQSGTDSTG